MIRSGSWGRPRRAGAGALGWVRRMPNRLRSAWRDRAESATAAPALPGPRERLEHLIGFYQRYEELVEVLCDGAQYGPEPKLEARYQSLRDQLQSLYPELRPFVRAFLRADEADEAADAAGAGRRRDAFEVLFGAPTLAEFLRSDDGAMISRIERTQDALSRYGVHLRGLAA